MTEFELQHDQDLKDIETSQKQIELERRLAYVKLQLDQVSSSFCLAKWKQVTLHLQNGFNHSCHHPDTHQADRLEVEKNPAALHNTAYKKRLREMMLKGERPKECSYCWQAEDTPGNHFSDRVIKSADDWAHPHLTAIAQSSPDLDVNPSYVEVSFGSECNFRCTYCRPTVSSSVWQSYQVHGPYIGQPSLELCRESGRSPIKPDDENPFLKAFWRWLPDLAKDLRILRVTGGEPLLNANTYRLLDFLRGNPQEHLSLCINSNLGVAARFFDQFLKDLLNIKAGVDVRDFHLFTSVDTFGDQAEFLRVGLNYSTWRQRVREYLQKTPWDLTIMVTFNLLSVPRFRSFLEDVLDLNQEFLVKSPGSRKRIILDCSVVQHPEYLSPSLLTGDGLRELDRIVDFMEASSFRELGAPGFIDYEIHKMRRIRSIAHKTPWTLLERLKYRAQFAQFIDQYEKREKTRFIDVFPELRDFLEQARQLTNLDEES